MVRVGDKRFQCDSRCDRVANRLVHFPVSRDDRFSHKRRSLVFVLGCCTWVLCCDISADRDYHIKVQSTKSKHYLSVRAVTPGKSSPAKNSNVAPPPVEMCVMRSATPALVTAATESPPPTTTVAPRSAASATA